MKAGDVAYCRRCGAKLRKRDRDPEKGKWATHRWLTYPLGATQVIVCLPCRTQLYSSPRRDEAR